MNNQDNTLKYLSYAAKISFVLYIFFVFFGTKFPFQERSLDVEDITGSNVFNQIIFSGLFLISFFTILFQWANFLSLIRREKFLTIFLLWCLISILWSDFPLVSFKRYFQFFSAFIIGAAALLYSDNVDENMKYFKYILAFFVIISIVSIFTIPGALDDNGKWKGLASGKNALGQVALLSIISWSISFKQLNGFHKKMATSILIILSLILLIGSRSGTSMISFGIVLMILGLHQIDKIFYPIGTRKLFSTIFITFFLLTIFSVITLYPNIFNELPGIIGKDITFTGRTFLWNEIIVEVNEHLLLGCGFQGYWVITSPKILELYKLFVWIPNQAHNGYLDILNEIGLIGLTLFVLLVANYVRNFLKYQKPNQWTWFIIITLIINLQETTLIRPQHPTGVLFMFSYLVLFVDQLKQNKMS